MKALRPIYLVLYYFLFVLAQFFVRLIYPIRALGLENIKGAGGYILAPNHISAIDPLFVLLARGFQKKMLIMGKEELFHLNFLLDFFWKVAGVFPVRRGSADKTAIEEAIKGVQEGRTLLIFPEGTRAKDGKVGTLKSGAFAVALMAGAEMIPCFIHYREGRLKVFRRITVIFGPPISVEELGLTGSYNSAKLRQAKEVYTAALENLRIRYQKELAKAAHKDRSRGENHVA